MNERMQRAGRKAAKTRKKNIRHMKQIRAGHKATDTRYSSELEYMKILSKNENIPVGCIFHHEGLPDLMALTETGKLVFCEIKPRKGARKRTLLNPTQKRAVNLLLKQNFVEKVLLVKYSKHKRGKPAYDDAIEITKKNIGKYSMKE